MERSGCGCPASASPPTPRGTIVDAGTPAGPLDLVAVDAALADTPNEPFAQPLSQSNRNEIALSSMGLATRADRVELTSIGGSLTAGQQWPGFRWGHRTTLGRDQEVVVVDTGVCYPFGLRAALTTTVLRRPERLGSADAAALRTSTTLRFLETHRRAPSGARFGRAFPFASVEVTRAVFEHLGELEVVYAPPRPTPGLEDLKHQRDVAMHQASEYFAWWSPLVDFVWTLANLKYSGNTDAIEYWEKAGRANELITEIAEAEEQGPAAPEETAMFEENLARSRAELMELQAAIKILWLRLQPLIGTPRDAFSAAWEVIGMGAGAEPGSDVAVAAEAAQHWLDLQYEISDLGGRIDAQMAAAKTTDVAGWLLDRSGAKVLFPVLLRTGSQQLHVSMPLLFVRDLLLPAIDTIPEFASLSDPALPGALDSAWTAARAGVVALEGQALDVVGSASPRAQDTHEVHALNILGDLGPDPFTPSLGRPQADDPDVRWSMQIALPTLRALGSEPTVGHDLPRGPARSAGHRSARPARAPAAARSARALRRAVPRRR